MSAEIGATSRRRAKVDALAALLARARPEELAVVVGFLLGRPRQGALGVGWATVSRTADAAASVASLEVLDVDAALAAVATTAGPGSQARRAALLDDLAARATAAEATLLQRLLLGEMRHGALDGVVAEAVARAEQVPLESVQRAAMLLGDLGEASVVARVGGADGLAAVGLQVGRGVQPMLAATASSVTEALQAIGPASVEWKLDGARIQVHVDGDTVRVLTRNLNDVTHRLPLVVATARALPVRRVVLDGEALAIGDDGRPERFQDTMRRFGSDRGEGAAPTAGVDDVLRPYFFDVLHVDGEDLLDVALSQRRAALARIAGPAVVPGIVTAEPAEAEAFAADALARGHEGVMVKALESTYAAGRRGAAWRKVKPVRTLDLVVLAAEWGSGRRQGLLSNLHLGARGPDGTFVMVGKTFKGLTDAVLQWQTEALLARAVGREGHVVHVRPELVVEVALDGVQRSRRYPGGVALRFARVRGYRPDRTAADADPIEAVRALA